MNLKVVGLLVLSLLTVTIYSQEKEQSQENKKDIVIDTSVTNPYSPTFVQRKIAAILVGSGAGLIFIGGVFSANPSWENAFHTDGPFQLRFSIGTTFLIIGIAEVLVGVPFLIVSEISKSKHDKWENSHNKLKISFDGSRLLMAF